MSPPDTRLWDWAAAISAIRNAARRTITERWPIPGGQTAVCAVEPVVGAAAARRLELCAGRTARDGMGDACQASRTWQQIGQVGGNSGETVAGAAYNNYDAGPPYTELAASCGQSFAWTRTYWKHRIGDRGPRSGSGDELGNARNGPRLAAAIAARDTQREAGQ